MGEIFRSAHPQRSSAFMRTHTATVLAYRHIRMCRTGKNFSLPLRVAMIKIIRTGTALAVGNHLGARARTKLAAIAGPSTLLINDPLSARNRAPAQFPQVSH